MICCRLDDQIWGSDEEQDEDEDEEEDEGKDEMNEETDAKDSKNDKENHNNLDAEDNEQGQGEDGDGLDATNGKFQRLSLTFDFELKFCGKCREKK